MVMWDEIALQISKEFPDVTWDKELVDAATARMVNRPATLDTIVATNLHADILSDLAAALAGSLGIAPTANLDPERRYPSMFEPIHGSAFDIMGKGLANPIGTFWSVVMMLEHLGEPRVGKAVDGRHRMRHRGSLRCTPATSAATRPPLPSQKQSAPGSIRDTGPADRSNATHPGSVAATPSFSLAKRQPQIRRTSPTEVALSRHRCVSSAPDCNFRVTRRLVQNKEREVCFAHTLQADAEPGSSTAACFPSEPDHTIPRSRCAAPLVRATETVNQWLILYDLLHLSSPALE